MKSLRDYITRIYESRVYEGGHAVTANPIPARISLRIYKEIETAVHDVDRNVEMCVLGSVGKKHDDDYNGDIDIAINIPNKDELVTLIKKAFPDTELNDNTAPGVISISYPYHIDNYTGYAQVDFMGTDDMNWTLFRFDSPNYKAGESVYKASIKAKLASLIISELPVRDRDARSEKNTEGLYTKRWKYTYNNTGLYLQLLDYTGAKGNILKNPKKVKDMERLISKSPDGVAKFVFGEHGDVSDFKSVESLWSAIHNRTKFPYGPEVLERIVERVKKCIPEIDIDALDMVI